uniref:SSD domain-containing protein n=1 Tax=Glossina pallidipes TaxID=7398 RepID=A0A1B0AH64_GLOPL
MGTLSGVQRLEILCTFAVMSVILNYIVFMTVYPACLSLVLDLSRSGKDMSLVREESLLLKALSDGEQKTNPVVQRVKTIMTPGLMIVHIYSRMVLSTNDYDTVEKTLTPKLQMNPNNNGTESTEFTQLLIKWLTDQIVILILLTALVIKRNARLRGAILIGNTELTETCENLILNAIDLTPFGDDILNLAIDIEGCFD